MDLGPCIESQGGMFIVSHWNFSNGTSHHFSRSFFIYIQISSTHCDLLEYIYIIQIHISIQEMVPEFLVPCIFVPSLPRTKKTHAGPSKQLLELLNQTGHFMFWIWLVVSKALR